MTSKVLRHVMPDVNPYVKYAIQIDCNSEKLGPSEGICIHLDGDIFEHGEKQDEIKIGKVSAWLILRGRAINEGKSLLDAMDAVSQSLLQCWEALFGDADDWDWAPAVGLLYEEEDLIENDLLLIESIELDEAYRGKGIGAKVVRETIATFGSSCALVACKPFPLQYCQWMNDEKAVEAGFEKKRRAAFGKVEKFWRGLGFNKLPGSEFFTYAAQLAEQPARINIAYKTRAASTS